MRNFAGNKKSVNFAVQNISPGGYQSGQMGQTVNLLAYAYGGSNPSPPTTQNYAFAEVAQLVEH